MGCAESPSLFWELCYNFSTDQNHNNLHNHYRRRMNQRIGNLWLSFGFNIITSVRANIQVGPKRTKSMCHFLTAKLNPGRARYGLIVYHPVMSFTNSDQGLAQIQYSTEFLTGMIWVTLDMKNVETWRILFFRPKLMMLSMRLSIYGYILTLFAILAIRRNFLN